MKSNCGLCLFVILTILISNLQFSIAKDKTPFKRFKNHFQDKNEQSCAQWRSSCARKPCCGNAVKCPGVATCKCNDQFRCVSPDDE